MFEVKITNAFTADVLAASRNIKAFYSVYYDNKEPKSIIYSLDNIVLMRVAYNKALVDLFRYCNLTYMAYDHLIGRTFNRVINSFVVLDDHRAVELPVINYKNHKSYNIDGYLFDYALIKPYIKPGVRVDCYVLKPDANEAFIVLFAPDRSGPFLLLGSYGRKRC